MGGRGSAQARSAHEFERIWTTASVSAPERFAYWQDVVWEAFVPVAMQQLGDGPFDGIVKTRSAGPVEVSRIISAPHVVMRTDREIAQQAGDVFYLNLPLAPGVFAEQEGRRTKVRRGDLVLIDASRPFEFGFQRDFRQISLTIPHDVLASRLAPTADVTAIAVSGSSGVGAVAARSIRALSRVAGTLDREGAAATADHVLGLVALAVGGVRPPVGSAGRAMLLQAAIDEIDRSLNEPELGPVAVAERIGISTRYLHRLFEGQGTTFGRTLLARRLERCRRDLSDPRRAHWTVAAIAAQYGFRDPSYMARVFRGRYGVSPRELRGAHAGPLPPV